MSPAITVHKVSKSYRSRIRTTFLQDIFRPQWRETYAVQDISLTIEAGELIGFIGPNGAGKTTTLKMLSGVLHPTSGTIDVLGFVPHQRNYTYLRQLALVMGQKNQLWWDLPAVESFKLHQYIYEISDDVYKKQLALLVELLGAEAIIHKQVKSLSLGQRMKCEIIAALLHNPRVLFLDEPTIGLDVTIQYSMRNFIKTYNTMHHNTIILTSHYMEDVKELCKRVVIINKGALIYDGKLIDIVRTFANYKLITATIKERVPHATALKYGEVIEITPSSFTIKTPLNMVTHTVSQILHTYTVDDINIDEPKIEDVIRAIFATHSV